MGLFRIFRYNQLIDENTRNHNFFCRKCALADDILHLAEHNSAARLCCHRNRLNVGQYRLILTGQVSILISGCTANECNINLRGLIRQIFRSTNLHNLDQFLFGDGVALTAFHARIDEGTDTDSTQLNIQSLGTATEHMLDDALREVVALHLQILLHLHDGMVRAVMTDDYALNHAFMRKMLKTALNAAHRAHIAYAGSGHDRHILRMAFRLESLFQRNADFFRKAAVHIASADQKIIILDQCRRFLRRTELSKHGNSSLNIRY